MCVDLVLYDDLVLLRLNVVNSEHEFIASHCITYSCSVTSWNFSWMAYGLSRVWLFDSLILDWVLLKNSKTVLEDTGTLQQTFMGHLHWLFSMEEAVEIAVEIYCMRMWNKILSVRNQTPKSKSVLEAPGLHPCMVWKVATSLLSDQNYVKHNKSNINEFCTKHGLLNA